MFGPPNHSAEYCSNASRAFHPVQTRIAGKLLWRFPVQKFRKFHSEDMSSPFRSYECRLFDNRCHRIHCLSQVVKQKLHVRAAFLLYAGLAGMAHSHGLEGLRGSMLTSVLSGIVRCDLFAGRITFSVLENAGPRFCGIGGELVPIHSSFDGCLGHK
jgi:hypothetical protein